MLFNMLYRVVLAFESADEILKCDNQIKATEQYFPGMLFIKLYKVVLAFDPVDDILRSDDSSETELLSSTFLWCCLLCCTLKVVLTFESVDEILKCDHSNKGYWAILSWDAVEYAVLGGFNFWFCWWNPKVWLKWKLLSSTFLWYCWLCCTRWF